MRYLEEVLLIISAFFMFIYFYGEYRYDVTSNLGLLMLPIILLVISLMKIKKKNKRKNE